MKNETKIRLTDVNDFITCVLCKGYLVDATTITECLHTFCKPCIVTYLEDKYTCPICDTILHQSHPYLFIAHDRTMQSIVYSIVSNLEKNELEREVNFYKDNELEFPPQLKEKLEKKLLNENKSQAINNNNSQSNRVSNVQYRDDEQIQLELKPQDGLPELSRCFVLCSCNSTVTTLKKFIAVKLFANLDKYKELEIFLNDELLGKDHTLKFIQVTNNSHKGDRNQPLRLNFRPKMIFN